MARPLSNMERKTALMRTPRLASLFITALSVWMHVHALSARWRPGKDLVEESSSRVEQSRAE